MARPAVGLAVAVDPALVDAALGLAPLTVSLGVGWASVLWSGAGELAVAYGCEADVCGTGAPEATTDEQPDSTSRPVDTAATAACRRLRATIILHLPELGRTP